MRSRLFIVAGVGGLAFVLTSWPDASARTTPDQGAPAEAPRNAAGVKVEQTTMGAKPAAVLIDSFDGFGVGFDGPHGMPVVRNPSDNSLAVGPDHIVQTVNTRLAIFTKKGKKYDTTGKVLYGAVPNNTVFAGFSGMCESTNNGDTVVRYDQLADRWLVVMPIFRRGAARPDQPAEWKSGDTVWTAPPGVRGQPGPASKLFVPPPSVAPPPTPAPQPPARSGTVPPPTGPYSMCYAVSVTSDPMGEYYRYEFLRPLFPDYPRPAVWPDGYYVPSSTSDDFIRGQLTNCVPQPGTERRLDAQGDKIMARVVYRNLGNRESIVAVHSVNTEAAAGGVRWYEFQVGRNRAVTLRQQGTYAPDGFYRWMASPAIDRFGNIGIGYSFGGTPHFAGQRFAGRLANDPLGVLTLRETVLVEGEAAQTYGLRWEDYAQTAVDPSDDCTIWYVGDYYKKDAANYSTKIGGFRLPACSGAR